MPRSLTLYYDLEDDFAIITPVKRCNLERFNHLLSMLHSVWSENNYQFSPKCHLIMERISNLLPRLDIEGYGIDLTMLSIPSLESLFIGVIKNHELQKCQLIELHDYEVRSRVKSKPAGTDLTPADVPIPSSGLSHADLIASLIGIDESTVGAIALYNNFDAEELSAIISQLNELRRDPQERLNEYLREQFDEWKAENKQVYHDAIFG